MSIRSRLAPRATSRIVSEHLENRVLMAATPVAEIGYDLDPRNGSIFSSTINKIVVAGSRTFFVPDLSSDRLTAGRELMVSDGTADGTRLVKDLTPGRKGSNISEMAAVGNNALFR